MKPNSRYRLTALVPLALALAAGIAGAQPTPRQSAQQAGPAPVGPAHATRTGMPRRLSDVHIEGEIPVPQVLFITARDSRRSMDFQHHRYLRSSLQLGAGTPFPAWVAVMNGSPPQPRKESSR